MTSVSEYSLPPICPHLPNRIMWFLYLFLPTNLARQIPRHQIGSDFKASCSVSMLKTLDPAVHILVLCSHKTAELWNTENVTKAPKQNKSDTNYMLGFLVLCRSWPCSQRFRERTCYHLQCQSYWVEDAGYTLPLPWLSVTSYLWLYIIPKNSWSQETMFQFWQYNPCELLGFWSSVDKVPVLLWLSSRVTSYWFLMFRGDTTAEMYILSLWDSTTTLSWNMISQENGDLTVKPISTHTTIHNRIIIRKLLKLVREGTNTHTWKNSSKMKR